MARQVYRLYGRASSLFLGQQQSTFALVNNNNFGAFKFSSSSDHIPVPTNVEEIDAGQKAQFSRQRSRDSNRPVLRQHTGSTFGPGFMSGAAEKSQNATDAHVGSYDCTGAVSLHSAMQTNVPEPFSASGKAPSHLNMPGGQWSQEDKYLAQERQDAHAAQDTPLPVHSDSKTSKAETQPTRQYSTSSTSSDNPPPPLSRKDQLKRAVKEYGATVIVFHVTISLLSLGGCYLAVSSGLDVAALLNKIGWGEYTAATGASTFVVAYAVHKVFAPVRISITLGSAPFIVRYLRHKGILKVPIKPKSS